ncbi:MAG: cell division protein ZapA [Myxococcota bacterium]|nr:cell division protein ZapA [Myxococcota bacterium]
MSIRKIDIAGHQITIRASSDDAHLEEVTRILDQRVREVKARIPDSTEALLFVSLALTDELLLAQQRLAYISEHGQARISELLQLLDHLDRGSLSRSVDTPIAPTEKNEATEQDVLAASPVTEDAASTSNPKQEA